WWSRRRCFCSRSGILPLLPDGHSIDIDGSKGPRHAMNSFSSTQPMPMDDSTNSRKGSPVAAAIVAFSALLVLYVLSPGPVIWLLTRADIEESDAAGKCVLFVFAPLIWLYEQFPVVHRACDWYFSLFGV